MSGLNEHPSIIKVSVMVNDIRHKKMQGSPREMARQVIEAVMEGELLRWDHAERVIEGGDLYAGPEIRQSEDDEAEFHRDVLVFYGPWVKGNPHVVRGQREAEAQSRAEADEVAP